MKEPFFKVQNLRLYYKIGSKEVKAVDDVSFVIEKPGTSLAIVGESACGKTSMARAILRLLPPNVSHFSGKIMLEGQDLTSFSEEKFRREIRWKKISWVPQGAAEVLNPVRTIGSLMKEDLIFHGVIPSFWARMTVRFIRKGRNYSIAKEEIERLLKMVGLPSSVQKLYPYQLSGGMKQRIVIAMALALKPPLIILDEPTSALDVSLQGQIINLLEQLKKEFSFSSIFITHNIALAASFCDLFAVIYGGKIVEFGTAEVLKTASHPYTQQLLECVPKLEVGAKVKYIPGEPPDLKSPPTGCRFHPRCPIAEPGLCEVKEPLLDPKRGHLVACHKA